MAKIKDKFEMIDPYNKPNIVRGYIYKSADNYGDLLITHVNDVEYNQHIHTTPKFYYPGKVVSHYKYRPGKFPEHDELYIFNKLDGTNICMFSYRDADGEVYRSYKTRLVPFLKEDGYSNWIDLWGRCIEKYSFIKELEKVVDYNFAFEMYGSINIITILYEEQLACKLLYGINNMGTLQLPQIFLGGDDIPRLMISRENPDDMYYALREQMDNKNSEILTQEGVMIYGLLEGKVQFAYKCKPETILSVMKIAMDKIPFREIYNTAINAVESMVGDDIYIETVNLLMEEYPDDMVFRHSEKIKKASAKALVWVKFRSRVISWYKKQDFGKFIPKETMPIVMKYFIGEDPRKIFQILNALYGG